MQPIVGDTDVQLMLDFRTGFPFTAVTETGNLAGAPDSPALPRIRDRECGAGTAVSVSRISVGLAGWSGKRAESGQSERRK